MEKKLFRFKSLLDPRLRGDDTIRKLFPSFLLSLVAIFCLIFPHPAGAQFRSEVIPLSSYEQTQPNKFYVWGSSSIYDFKDDFTPVKIKGTTYANVVGLDYRVIPDLRVGSYFFYGHSNSHSPIGNTSLKTNNESIYPYATYYFTPKFFANVLLRYTYLPTHIKRFNLPNPTPITSKSKGELYATYPSLNLSLDYANFYGTFQGGYGYEYLTTPRFKESNNNIIRASIYRRSYTFFFSDVSYLFQNIGQVLKTIAPYGQGGFDYNLQLTPIIGGNGTKFNRAREGYTAGAGIRFFFAKDVTLSAGWQRIAGHSGQSQDIYTLFLRVGVF